MFGFGFNPLRRGHSRPAAAFLAVIALLAQSFALPWHLALAHHHDHEDGEHLAGASHEHPDLPADHDEDDHASISMTSFVQSRHRGDESCDSTDPLAVLPASAAGAPRIDSGPPRGARSCASLERDPWSARSHGARAPPKSCRLLHSLSESG
jgi:hypothetical protein